MILSPNVSIRPTTAGTSSDGHLLIGGCDAVELARSFGTPLWVMDEATIRAAAAAYEAGLSCYGDFKILYAGKAFLCLYMCHLLKELGLGLDVVSEGELFTARAAGLSPELIYLHGNNKSETELRAAIDWAGVRVVVDNVSELRMLESLARGRGRRVPILLRLIPGVEPDTHTHIKTGHDDSKFGIPLSELESVVSLASSPHLDLLGIHSHIGSQACEIEPYLENIDILSDVAARLKAGFNVTIEELDVGGGLGIAYTRETAPVSIFDWALQVASRAQSAFRQRGLELPRLLVEPGRSIVGSAGVTLYRAGHSKSLPSGTRYLAVDGGMADNPRPITYQARYSACVANRLGDHDSAGLLTIVGKYCESGDIIIKDARLSAAPGDLIAVFGTGAYNFSMASNYNRSPRPACVLVADGQAEVIVERETNEDLLRLDRVPERFLR